MNDLLVCALLAGACLGVFILDVTQFVRRLKQKRADRKEEEEIKALYIPRPGDKWTDGNHTVVIFEANPEYITHTRGTTRAGWFKTGYKNVRRGGAPVRNTFDEAWELYGKQRGKL